MEHYRSNSGKPYGATAYEIGVDHIIIQFQHKDYYKYSHNSCGVTHVNNMIAHALANNGLSTYVAKNRPDYETKF